MVVHEFVEEHNHDLHLQEIIHMLSSQQKVSELHCNEIDLAYDDGLQQRKSFQFDMSKEMGYVELTWSLPALINRLIFEIEDK